MARPLTQMALDSLEFCSAIGVGRNTMNIKNFKNKYMSQIDPIASKKMPWEHLNKSAYKGGKNG